MAEIREKFTLEDKVSPSLDNLINRFGSVESAEKRLLKEQAALESKLTSIEIKFDALSQSLEQMEQSGNAGTVTYNRMVTQIDRVSAQIGVLENSAALVAEQLDAISQNSNAFSEVADNVEEFSGEVDDAGESAEEAAAEFDETEKSVSRFGNAIKRAGKYLGGQFGKLMGGLKNMNPFNALQSQALRFSATLLSVTKLISYLKNTMKVAPEEVQTSWGNLQNSISRFLNSGLIGILNSLKAGFDKLNEALNSPAGQKFAAGMYTVGQAVGQAISFVFDVVSSLVEFIGNNFDTIMAVAGMLLLAFAGYMMFTAVATMLANLPLVMLIALLAGLVMAFTSTGESASDTFEMIGEAAAWLYALGYNLVADIWNLIADFANFFAHVFDDPVGAIGHLFVDLASFVLGILQSLASAIDAIFGSNLAGAVGGWIDSIQSWADDTFGEQEDVVEKMQKKDANDIKKLMGDWGNKASNFGDSLSDFNLTQTAGGLNIPSSVGGINSSVGGSLGSDVSAIKKEVQMSDEELQSLVDLAQRRYVNEINLTTQSPVINISGQNTGDSEADKKALADTLRDILIEQSSAGTLRSTARVY